MKLTEKLANKLRAKIGEAMRPQVEAEMKKFESITVQNICKRIEALALDVENNYDLEYILNDIRNGGYHIYDKKESTESN